MKLNVLFIALSFSVAVPGFGQTTDCVPAPSGLVGWWKAEANANDSSGINNGSITGGVSFVSGEVGQAFSFDGVHGQVSVPASGALNVGRGSGLTIEAWVQPLGTAGWPMFDWSRNGAFGAHFWVNITPGNLYANLVDSNGNYHIVQSAGGLLSTSNLQHVAVTYDKASGLARLFLNGAKVAESNLGTFAPYTSSDLQIGYHLPGAPFGEYAFKGLIDEASLYNRALGTNEIQAIFAAGAAGKCAALVPPSILEQPQSQVGYWGRSVTFNVRAAGSQPLTYVWYKDGFGIAWATNSSLTLTNVLLGDGGNYSVNVSNSVGSVTSSNAFLMVNPAGVSLGIYAGVTVEGTPGNTYGIQYATNISQNATWLTLTQFTLVQPIQVWADTGNNVAGGGNPQRYYRVVAVP